MGAMTIRLGTVRPFSVTGRDRMRAARDAEGVTVTWGSSSAGGRRETVRYVHTHRAAYPTVGRPPGDPGHARGRHPLSPGSTALGVIGPGPSLGSGSEVHVIARHAATGRRGGLLRLVGDDGLGGEEQRGDGGGV